MTRVFIGGSRRVTRLDDAVRRRLSRIVEQRLPVLVGDANGADKAVQGYLRDCTFDRVEVYAADASPRNNLGGWPVRVICPPGRSTRLRVLRREGSRDGSAGNRRPAGGRRGAWHEGVVEPVRSGAWS